MGNKIQDEFFDFLIKKYSDFEISEIYLNIAAVINSLLKGINIKFERFYLLKKDYSSVEIGVSSLEDFKNYVVREISFKSLK